jgi:two-component system alkaline phosphatase synthesis response regulator PhoP
VQKYKILVVDDEEITTDLAKRFLERYDFEVVCSHDGEGALKAAYSELPNLILLDVMLPDIDGFEVCQRLKSDAAFKKVPILMFTAKGLNRDRERGRLAGADDYIVKPFSGKALVEVIKKHLGIE